MPAEVQDLIGGGGGNQGIAQGGGGGRGQADDDPGCAAAGHDITDLPHSTAEALPFSPQIQRNALRVTAAVVVGHGYGQNGQHAQVAAQRRLLGGLGRADEEHVARPGYGQATDHVSADGRHLPTVFAHCWPPSDTPSLSRGRIVP
jgi:hypothetical protein